MSFCPKCGKEIGNWKFCNHCGTNLNELLLPISNDKRDPSDNRDNKDQSYSSLPNSFVNATNKRETKADQNLNTIQSKKSLIIVSSIIGVLVIVIAFLVIAIINNSDPNNSQVTQNEYKELSTADKLLKAKDYFGQNISLSNYDPYILDEEESSIYINTNNDFNYDSKLSNTICVGSNTPITFIKTTTSDLLSCGFVKGDKRQEDIDNMKYSYADDVCLLYNNKRLYIDENKDGAIEFGLDCIRALYLPANEAVDFEYCGIKNGSSLQEVVNNLGEPSASSDIHYDSKNDSLSITLSYVQDIDVQGFEFAVSVFAYFIFDYDYKNDTAILKEIYMFA